MKNNPDTNAEPMDIEDLVKLGGYHGPCPFYLAREMTGTAEIIFMPYNYLTEPMTRISLKIDWIGSIIIFDEAHNLSVCLQGWLDCKETRIWTRV
jgi:regulator of telomere elongation helicase 1